MGCFRFDEDGEFRVFDRFLGFLFSDLIEDIGVFVRVFVDSGGRDIVWI